MRHSTRVRSSLAGALVVLAVAAAQSATGASTATSLIVFSALPDGVSPAQLFRIDTSGAGLTQLTHEKIPSSDPAFSPDGKRIAFVRVGSGVFLMNVDGSGVRRLTSGAHDLFPVWSPNGKRIAFIRQYRNDWRLYVMSSSGRGLRRIGPPAGRPTWTADSKSVFIPSRGALEKIDARTGRLQRHVQFTTDVPLAATVSPDTRNVAFVGSRPSIPGCGEVSCVVFALYLANVPRPHVRKFVNDGGPAGWSPDSKRLVFVYRGGLALWPIGSGARTKLSVGSNVAQADAPPAWQPR